MYNFNFKPLEFEWDEKGLLLKEGSGKGSKYKFR